MGSNPGGVAVVPIKSVARAEISSKPTSRPGPWAVLHSTSAYAYLAQPRGCGMSRRRPQRHIEHDDAIHNNERGNHHDENKIPE